MKESDASNPSDRPNSRRDFLFKSVAILPTAATLTACSPKTSSSSSQTESQPAAAAHPDTADYKPNYFNAEEWAFIKAAVDRLIPSDAEGPGALDLNVPVFIDKQMDAVFGHASNWYTQGPFKPDASPLFGYQGPLKPRELYRASIAALNEYCGTTFGGKRFVDLPPDQQDKLFHDIDSGTLKLDKVPIGDFFTFLVQNTKEGYLADPMYGGNKDAAAWKMIGFPGARADFLDWVGEAKTYPFAPVTIDGK